MDFYLISVINHRKRLISTRKGAWKTVGNCQNFSDDEIDVK